MLTRILSNPRFLAIYSGTVTLTFMLTVVLILTHGGFALRAVAAAQAPVPQPQTFDQITVRRINVVEPDGTPRLIIAAKADFPGEFFKGKELSRTDRNDSAGMLFMNDEGTENGGLIFGGHQSSDGKVHSFGHLSFDEYEEDQTLTLDTSQQGDSHFTAYQINDAQSGLETPEVLEAFQKLREMPQGPERQKARVALIAKYHVSLTQRAGLERDDDKSVALRLRDPQGNTRLLLRVAADGTPGLQFLDASGKVTHKWPDASGSGQ
jgi:hypothetical protein